MARDKFSLWKETFGLEELRCFASNGLSDEELAIRIGIGLSLFRRWKKKYSEFREAIELGRREADFAVVKALYKKATGYNVSLSKTYKLKRVDYDPETGKKLREYEELATGIDETYVPADLRAETFWLKNRQPEAWSEGKEKNICEEAGGIIEIPEADLISLDED